MRKQLIEVARFFDAVDAHILRGLLEAEDIYVEIFDEQFTSLTPADSIISSGVKLLVPSSLLDKAEPIIKLYYDNLNKENGNICPECNSLDVRRDYKKQVQTFFYSLVGMIFGTGFNRKTPYFKKCNSCQYKW